MAVNWVGLERIGETRIANALALALNGKTIPEIARPEFYRPSEDSISGKFLVLAAGRIHLESQNLLAFREDFGMSYDKPTRRAFGSIVPAPCKLRKDGHPLCWHWWARSKA